MPPASESVSQNDDAAPADTRITAIEREQERQGTVLDHIVTMLSSGDTSSPVTRGDDPGPSMADMSEQMRQAIRDVNAENAAKDDPKQLPAEMSPREVMIKGKDRLQQALFGKDPNRR